jgi:hypothetical protein
MIGVNRDGRTEPGPAVPETLKGVVMEMLIFLLIVFVLLDIAAVKGWAPDTRDSRDWTVSDGRTAHSTPFPARTR